jgi:hypothetical protein
MLSLEKGLSRTRARGLVSRDNGLFQCKDRSQSPTTLAGMDTNRKEELREMSRKEFMPKKRFFHQSGDIDHMKPSKNMLEETMETLALS